MNIPHWLAEIAREWRFCLAVLVAASVLYFVGYCNGDLHGTNSVRIASLEHESVSMKRLADSLHRIGTNQSIALNEALKRAELNTHQRDSLLKVVGKIIIKRERAPQVGLDTPRVVEVPGAILDLLAQDSVVIDGLQQALDSARAYAQTEARRAAVEAARADSNWTLYQLEKKSKHKKGFVSGLVTGALGTLGLMIGIAQVLK